MIRPPAILLLFALFALPVISVSGATVYVAQTATGSGSGADTSDRKAIATVNSSWPLSPGDTLSLGGTFTTGLIIGGNGTSGSPETVLFESGANFTKAAWGDSGPTDKHDNDPIYCGAPLSYVIIDGGANGLITATANGAGLANSNSCSGVYIAQARFNVEVRNLTITNLFQPEINDTNGAGTAGIQLWGLMTNCSIHNCYVQTVGNGCEIYYGAGISSSLQIYSNQIYHISWGAVIDGSGDDAVVTNDSIWANKIDYFEDYTGDYGCHQDGIYCYIQVGHQTNYNLSIYRNKIGPHIATNSTTAAVFITTEDTQWFINAMVYNNVFLIEDGDVWGNGFVAFGFNGTLLVANNTYVETGANQGCTCLEGGNQTGTATFTNNLAINVGEVFYQSTGGQYPVVITGSDYNNVSSGLGTIWWSPGSFSWVVYQLAGQFAAMDRHSSAQTPALDANYAPLASDTVANGKGINLTALGITADFNGNPRPATGPWTIGAFQVAVTNTPSSLPEPPTALHPTQ